MTFEDDRQCRVEAGRWWASHLGHHLENPRHIDVDHHVPLKNAHLWGGWRWDAEMREECANYLGGGPHSSGPLAPFDQLAPAITAIYPGVLASTRYNSSLNAHELISFGPVFMTESAVRRRGRMPRRSRSRESYARHAVANFDGQAFFLLDSRNVLTPSPLPASPDSDSPGAIYGILVYSCIPNQPYTIDYIGIGFPDPTYRRFVATLNLTYLTTDVPFRSAAEEVQD